MSKARPVPGTVQYVFSTRFSMETGEEARPLPGSTRLYRREFMCYLVHKVPGWNSGPESGTPSRFFGSATVLYPFRVQYRSRQLARVIRTSVQEESERPDVSYPSSNGRPPPIATARSRAHRHNGFSNAECHG